MSLRPSLAVGQWILFGLLSLVWGSSYFWIKVGVDEGLTPFTLITLRLAIATVALVLLMAATRSRLPRDRATYAKLAVLGVINVALPFGLITWAEQYVGSALASIINALVPLFVIVFAALALRDEPFTLNRLGGLLIGFMGAVLLLGRHLAPAVGADHRLAAEHGEAARRVREVILHVDHDERRVGVVAHDAMLADGPRITL